MEIRFRLTSGKKKGPELMIHDLGHLSKLFLFLKNDEKIKISNTVHTCSHTFGVTVCLASATVHKQCHFF